MARPSLLGQLASAVCFRPQVELPRYYAFTYQYFEYQPVVVRSLDNCPQTETHFFFRVRLLRPSLLALCLVGAHVILQTHAGQPRSLNSKVGASANSRPCDLASPPDNELEQPCDPELGQR